MDELLLALDERLQKVDGVTLEGSQVGSALDGEEVEPEEGVRDHELTYTSRLERYFEANMEAVTYCMARSLSI